MKKKKNTVTTIVAAWVANKSEAAKFTKQELGVISRQFNGRVSILHLNKGELAIFPSHPGCRKNFDEFMTQFPTFQLQSLRVEKN